jgi:hypothetical protein
MTTPAIIASGVVILVVLAAVAFRLLFGASQVASASALGRLNLPKSWRRFLLGERDESHLNP